MVLRSVLLDRIQPVIRPHRVVMEEDQVFGLRGHGQLAGLLDEAVSVPSCVSPACHPGDTGHRESAHPCADKMWQTRQSSSPSHTVGKPPPGRPGAICRDIVVTGALRRGSLALPSRMSSTACAPRERTCPVCPSLRELARAWRLRRAWCSYSAWAPGLSVAGCGVAPKGTAWTGQKAIGTSQPR